MNNGLEIERKFLVRFPKKVENIRRQIDILQTYLVNGEDGSQRRVRRIAENDSVKYVYTEKIFYTPVTRKETEYEITGEKYEELIGNEKKDTAPIEKRRICFEYREQLFELDTYPFSDSLAIMELELDAPEQEIYFPDFIDVIKEVTGVEGYSNASLANAGAFPSDSETPLALKGEV